MTTAKIGQVIKWKNSDGTLNGGTIVDFIQQNGEQKVLVNNFEDKRLTISVSQMIIIKHQRNEGKPSSAIIKRTIKECKQHNEQLKIFGPNEKQVKTTEDKLHEMVQERNSLICKINKLEALIEEKNEKIISLEIQQENAQKEIEKLSDKCSLDIIKITGENKQLEETISTLCDCILMLKQNNETDAFELLLNRIKKLQNIL